MKTFTKATATKVIATAFNSKNVCKCGAGPQVMQDGSKFDGDVFHAHKAGCEVLRAKCWLMLNK